VNHRGGRRVINGERAAAITGLTVFRLDLSSTDLSSARPPRFDNCLLSLQIREENLLHHRPPFTRLPRSERLLKRGADLPPTLHGGMFKHPVRIRVEIRPVIFPVGEQQVFRLLEED
jgi:hypothetical protein